MEWNPQDLHTLSQCFINTLSPSPEPRRRAESILSDFSQKPNYGLAVLRLVAEPNVADEIRQAASVNFKNHLKVRWSPAPNSDEPRIQDAEKEQIKALIVSLMLNATPRIQGQLSEALVLIGKHDFPRLWPNLLPELTGSLQKASQAGDYASVNGILSTANSIFKKFRHEYKTNELLYDLKYCLDNFAAPLLEIFMKTANLIESAANAGGGNAAALKPLFESQRLCCRVFFSLNYQELPEFFEDHMNEWMTEQMKYLANSYPALENTADGLALVDELRAAVCENINLYMEKNEEEFQAYLNGFALAVWNLLTAVSQSSSRDQLAVTAIKFLTTVSTSVHHSLFVGEGVIPQICQGIVIPNVMLRDEDMELFEMNYIEFIRRDMEGSDLDTRRRIACELLKGIATNYKAQVTNLVSVQIQNLLTSFAANPKQNWKDKDCAIYLVVSLATKRAGGTSVTTDLVDVQSFFGTVIVPELQSQDVNGFPPMLKAGALKFFTMFRNHIPKPMTLQFFPDLIRFLCAESNVVHSYAASCIEKLLLVKDEGGQARYTSVDISPLLPQLMNNLFEALKVPESEENQYVMKCIMRVLGVADISREIVGPCIMGLTSILNKACENPKNPVFNHYVFESVAVLVKRACGKDASLITVFEINLFPSIQKILVEDVQEFYPYALQLLAQLVELNRPPIPQSYMQIFPMLLSPDSWRKASNVPALVRLLQAFLKKAPHELNQEGSLRQVLEISNKLVSARSTDEQGFYVLNTVVESLDFNVIAPYIGQIWSSLFTVLQTRQTPKFIKCLLIFMSLVLVKHGSTNLVESVNGIQANLFLMILGQFWISNLTHITGFIETKLTAVASTRLLCESQMLLDAAVVEHWGKLLNSIITLLSRAEQDRVEEDPEMPEFAENVGYSATFIRLHNAGKTEDDPLKDIRDAKEFLVTSLARLSAQFPGRYSQIISQYVEPANQAELLCLCNSYKCQFV